MIRFSSLFELLLAAACHWCNNKQTYFRLCVGTGFGSNHPSFSNQMSISGTHLSILHR